MGRIIQKSKAKDLIPEEKKPLRITQWKFIKPDRPGLEVCMGYHVYFIKDMTMRLFHQLNAANMELEYEFKYLRSALICERCAGKGIIDWVDKAISKVDEMPSVYLNDVLKYIRNKKGPVNILECYDGKETYTSSPTKRKGENFCPDCFGCGIRLQHISHSKTTRIHPS